MPNHWHFLVWPAEDGQLANFMHHLTTTHATRWNRARGLGGTGHVYQGPYKFFPGQRDEHSYQVSRYVVRGAQRLAGGAGAQGRGLARVQRLSAVRSGYRGRPLPLGPQGLQWVNQPQSEAELAALRRAVARGCPLRQ